MSKRIAVALLAAAAVAGLVSSAVGCNAFSESNRTAPELPSQVLQGPRVDLASLRGRPALINFWASWCKPCNQEAPELERLARTLRGEARLVGVDWNDTTANATAFIREHGLTYPNLRDGSSQVGNDFGLRGLPTTFVLDSKGRIVRTLPGPQTSATLREALASLPSSGD